MTFVLNRCEAAGVDWSWSYTPGNIGLILGPAISGELLLSSTSMIKFGYFYDLLYQVRFYLILNSW